MDEQPFIEGHRGGAAAWVDMVFVPDGRRGRGEGRRLYEEWEAGLPGDVEMVLVFAADTEGEGNSDGFWEALGFSYRFEGDEDDLSYDAAHTMVKGVNGHPTPAPAG